MGKGSRRWGRVAVLVMLLLWVAGSRAAWAHVTLLAAIPEPGATLTTSPPEVQLTFDGEITLAASQVVLFNEAFQSVPGVALQPDSGESNRLAAQIPPLDPGRYTVQWSVISTDGHPISGSYAFALVEQPLRQRIMVPLIMVLLLVIIGVAALYWTRVRAPKNLFF